MKNYNIDEYVGKKVGDYLTVIGIDKDFKKRNIKSNHWIFRCECGNEFSISPSRVFSGKKKSCGCMKTKLITKHGCNRNEFYPTWWQMMQRCYNKEHHNYQRYGNRGIYVCDEWKDPKIFIEWAYSTIGHKKEGYTLDRINNDGPYSPENCRWATSKEQQRNKRNTKVLTFNGETRPLVEWCDLLGIKYTTVRERLRHGWTVDEALSYKSREIVHQPEKRVCDRYYTIDGVEKNISDWAKQYNISCQTVYKRLNKGWDIIDALSTPQMVKHERFITYKGETKRVFEWAKEFGISQKNICGRLDSGWSVEDALTKPLGKSNQKKITPNSIQDS